MKILLDFRWVEVAKIVEMAFARYEEETKDKVKLVFALGQADLLISDFGVSLFSATLSSAKEVGCVAVFLRGCPVADTDFGWLGVLRKLSRREIPTRLFQGESLCAQKVAEYLIKIGEPEDLS